MRGMDLCSFCGFSHIFLYTSGPLPIPLVVVALVDDYQFCFDVSYFIGAEFVSVVEAVAQLVFFLDGRC